MDHKVLVGDRPHVEMGSLNGRSVQDYEEHGSEKMNSFHAPERRSFSGSSNVEMIGKVSNSVKIVLLSNKLNWLVLFGPLTILVQTFTGHHGWVFFFSLLGIMPLAERLVYATDWPFSLALLVSSILPASEPE